MWDVVEMGLSMMEGLHEGRIGGGGFAAVQWCWCVFACMLASVKWPGNAYS